jgi:hypothetical protein
VAELADLKLPQPPLDGKSLVQVLRKADAPSPHDVLHWQVTAAKQVFWAVREGDWQLIRNAQDTSIPAVPGSAKKPPHFPLFLSNIADDIGEKTNHATTKPEIVQRLRTLHDDWLRQIESEAAKTSKP